MNNSSLEQLVQDYLSGKIEAAEMYKEIQNYTPEEVKQCFSDLMEVDYLLSKKYLKVDQEAAFSDFLERIKFQTIRDSKPKKRTMWTWGKYAAVFIGLVGLTFGLNLFLKSNHTQRPLTSIDNEVNLLLNNGKVEIITETGISNISDAEGKIIAVKAGNRIKYMPAIGEDEIRYNELIVPRGKKFELELADGTLIYINAESSLKYPTSFTAGNQRQVFLTGEAFFKVAENKQSPFIVHSGDVNVSVLGTEFNVSNYSDESYARTVLVSGSVAMYRSSTPDKEKTKLQLVPGEMATWSNEKKEFKVNKVETSIYTSWIYGRLIFRDCPFKDIQKQLERHFNVKIVNHNTQLNNNTFSANFENESIDEILEILDRTYGVEYTKQDNQIIIN